MPNGEAFDDEIDLDEPALTAIADAILDGEAIDWTQVQSNTSTDPALARELRALASVAALHRTLSSGDSTTSNEARPNTTQPTWGQLQLREKVGQGAFGEVFRAWDPHLSREVALKLLGPAIGQGEDDRSWVLKEARFLAAIRHPNVVTVHGADRIDGRVGFWTEFIDGRTLAELVHDDGVISADEAAAIGIDVCRAVAAVHRAGLLHRDIKANNVMRERGGRIVLLDFGATKDFLPDVTPGAIIGDPNGPTGTPLYVAPELWGEREATPQSDIYSVGVLLYFLVTGSYPVQGATVGEVAQAHRAGRRLSLGEARPDLPTSFVATVERAIATDPATRFATIQELEQALSAVGRPKQASVGSRGRLAAVTLVMIAGVAVYLMWPGDQTPSMRASVVEALRRASIAAVQPSAQAPDPVVTLPTAPLQEPAPSAEAQKPIPGQTNEPLKILAPAEASDWSKPSLDGRYFAFIDNSGGVRVWDVARNRVWTAKEPVPGEQATSVLISRQGDRVAYVWKYLDGTYDVQVAQSDGSRPILVLERRTAYRPELRDWSHDGKELVGWLVEENNRADLVVLQIEGRTRQVLYAKPDGPTRASISPDGRFVVFGHQVATEGRSRIETLIVGRDGVPPRVLERDAGVPEWMADGRHLVVLRPSSTDPLTRDAWLVPTVNGFSAGVGVKVVENIVARVGNFQAFPTNDGRLLTVVESTRHEILSAPFDMASGRTTAAPTLLLRERIGGQASPSWSPNGETIAFVEMRQRPVPGLTPVYSLATLDISSNRVHQVRPRLFSQRAYRPEWLPDGLHVILWGQDAASPDRVGLYRVNVRTGEATPLRFMADGGLLVGPLSALPDGSGFIYKDPRGWISRTFEGQESVIIESSAWKDLRMGFALAPGGARWAFGAVPLHGERSTIMVQDAGREAREILVAGSNETVVVQCWAPDGSAVFFSRGEGLSRTIWMVNRDGSNEHAVGLKIPNQPNPMTINRDGTRIVLPEQVRFRELWVRDIKNAGARPAPVRRYRAEIVR